MQEFSQNRFKGLNREQKKAMKENIAVSLLCYAQEINAKYKAGEESTQKGLEHYRMAGFLLRAAKSQCGHGKWLEWLKENVVFGDRRARQLMALTKLEVTSDLEFEWRRIQGNTKNDVSEPTPSETTLQPTYPPTISMKTVEQDTPAPSVEHAGQESVEEVAEQEATNDSPLAAPAEEAMWCVSCHQMTAVEISDGTKVCSVCGSGPATLAELRAELKQVRTEAKQEKRKATVRKVLTLLDRICDRYGSMSELVYTLVKVKRCVQEKREAMGDKSGS